jgi:dTMP kinase
VSEQGSRLSSVDGLRRAPSSSLAAVLRIRDFRRLWIGLGLSSLGDWIGLLALTAMANEMAGPSYAMKNFAIAGVLFLRVLPALVIGPVAGYVADRMDRRRTLIWGDYLRGALFLTIPLVGTLWWVFVVTVLVEAVSLVWGPAKDATIPNLVPRHRLEAANQISLATTYGSALPAAALFTALTLADKVYRELFEWFPSGPIGLALYFNAVSFLVSGFVIATLKDIPRGAAARDSGYEGHPVKVVVDGWRYVARTPVVRGLVIGIAGAFAAGGVVIALARTFVSDLGGGEPGYGVLFGAVFLGLGLGMWLGPRLFPGLSRRRLFGLALTGAGLMLFPVALVRQLEVVTGLAVARLPVRGSLDHRQHPARPRGARRSPGTHVRLRRLHDPAGARRRPGRGSTAGRTDRHARLRPDRRDGQALGDLQRRGLHVPRRRRRDDGGRCRLLSFDGRPQRSSPGDRPAPIHDRVVRRLLRDRRVRRVRGR